MYRYESLLEKIRAAKRLAVAFSGGVDSTFLAKAAKDALGENSVAITVVSDAYPPDSFIKSREITDNIGIKLIEINVDVLNIPMFCENPPDRCYHCKKELFKIILEKASEMGFKLVADGSNADDSSDYRPGERALKELGIWSPLRELDFTKKEIRELSRNLGLTTWNMQSSACLASRFVYGEMITKDALERTWKAEKVLSDSGFRQYRVRNHGNIARIEVPQDKINIILDDKIRKKILVELKKLGYDYVTLDLEGYRMGSMNEIIGK